MSRRQRYPWPTEVGVHIDLPVSNRHAANSVRFAAYKFAERRGWVFRTRWIETVVRVRRVA